MKFQLLTLAVALSLLAACGDGVGSSPTVPTQQLRDDAKMSIYQIYSPDLESNIECVVVTSTTYRGRAVAVSCNWP